LVVAVMIAAISFRVTFEALASVGGAAASHNSVLFLADLCPNLYRNCPETSTSRPARGFPRIEDDVTSITNGAGMGHYSALD